MKYWIAIYLLSAINAYLLLTLWNDIQISTRAQRIFISLTPIFNSCIVAFAFGYFVVASIAWFYLWLGESN